MTTSSTVTPAGEVSEQILGHEPPPDHRWLDRKRLIIALIALVVLVGAAVGIWLAVRGGGSSSASPLSVTTEHATVSTGTMKETVAASGTIQPAEEANLQFAVAGQVTAVDVATGQKVTAGQTLATVGSAALQDDVDAAQATLSAAQAKLSSDTSADAATSQIDSDDAAVTSAQSQLTSAQTNLADASLTSTMSGTVASVNLSVGDQVSGGGSGSSGLGSTSGSGAALASRSNAAASSSSTDASSSSSAQIVVISTNSYSVSTTVDDTQVGEVKVGDQVVITPSDSTTDVYGTVSSVGLIASSSTGVASFPVTIAITGDPSGLYPGATANISIIVEQLNNVVEVPTAAISYTTGSPTVTEVEGGSNVSEPVTTGLTVSGETQIVSGLKAGDVVLERVVKFNASSNSVRSLLGGGGSGTGNRTGGGGFPGGAFPGGGFPGGGFGGGGAGTGGGGGFGG